MICDQQSAEDSTGQNKENGMNIQSLHTIQKSCTVKKSHDRARNLIWNLVVSKQRLYYWANSRTVIIIIIIIIIKYAAY